MVKLEEPIQKSPKRLFLIKIFPIIVASGGYYFDYIKDWVVAIVTIFQECSSNQKFDGDLRSRGMYGAWMIAFTFFRPLVNMLDCIRYSFFNLVISILGWFSCPLRKNSSTVLQNVVKVFAWPLYFTYIFSIASE